MVDSLAQVVVNWVEFTPLPANFKKFAVLFTTEGYSPKE